MVLEDGRAGGLRREGEATRARRPSQLRNFFRRVRKKFRIRNACICGVRHAFRTPWTIGNGAKTWYPPGMAMTDRDEQHHEAGRAAAFREMLGVVLRGLGRDAPPTTLEAAQRRVGVLEAERSAVVVALRRLCEEHGDLGWDDDLHLADVIEKHLGRYLNEPKRDR